MGLSPFQAAVSRRGVVKQGAALAAAFTARHLLASPLVCSEGPGVAAGNTQDAPVLRDRPAPSQRRFHSAGVEAAIARVHREVRDPVLAATFERCFPNTLDTTVFPGTYEGKADTYVITGDIDAMWLRDSAAQMWPYLAFAVQDRALAELIEGVIRRQARLILIDSYANAFCRNPADPPLSWAVHDDTEHYPGVAERKWEIDSLCYPVRLAYGYWKRTGSVAPFEARWKAAAARIVQTFREQQRFKGEGPYRFTRQSSSPTDTLPNKGHGTPARPVGLIFSGFRPSDDACLYPLFIPANLFAVVTLRRLAEMQRAIYHDEAAATECTSFAAEVEAALSKWSTVERAEIGRIWAYEVDGYGNVVTMDDANAPGLLSLPYLECCSPNDALYRRTRGFVLSEANPYFFKGKAAEGIGGPHIGQGFIWPMSISMRALTSQEDREIAQCLRWLRDTTAGTHFMHEAFQADDAAQYTRPWFAWANGLFGELILKLLDERPALLAQPL